MVGPHEGDGEAALVRGTAGVHGIDVLDALLGEIHAELEIRDDLGPRLLRDLDGIAHMIAVAMGEQDVRDALCDLRLVALETRVAGEERIDEHGCAGEIEPEGGMTEPCDFHKLSSFRQHQMGHKRPRTTFHRNKTPSGAFRS